MAIVNPQEVPGLIQRTLGHVDPRLSSHGQRVAFFVSRMLRVEKGYTDRQKQDLTMLALLHDLGAYKIEEIDHVMQLESTNIWNHAVYGYLFLRDLSPLRLISPAILFHHLDYVHHERLKVTCAHEAQLIYVADRADILINVMKMKPRDVRNALLSKAGENFDPAVVRLFLTASDTYDMMVAGKNPPLEKIFGQIALSEIEVQEYLKMLVFALDFRSRYTITNAVTTTSIATSIAQLMGLDMETQSALYYGTLLHDIGKVGIPVEILDFPGKLSLQATGVVQTHVAITAAILGDAFDETAKQVALRHHEKLDGSGYPLHLKGEMLSLPERIVVVADIVGALGGTRTYKDAYPKDTTIDIITQMADAGKLDRTVVEIMTKHFDRIMANVEAQSTPVLRLYGNMNQEYEALMECYVQTKPAK